jgi:N-acetylglucosaminyldiphosphoundecaprenol N-acetyl-beta-D-mannosaminyltransferase
MATDPMSTTAVAHFLPPAGGGSAPMRFGAFPITETQTFPPAPAHHCWVYVTLNAEIALSLPHSAALQQLLPEQRLRVSVDGQWLWWALKRRNPGRTLAKLSGSDLIYTLAAHCASNHQRLLLVGASPAANGRAVQRLRRRWPDLQVAGYAPPAYTMQSLEESRVIGEALAAIDTWQPQFVVLGLGAPKEHRLAGLIAPALDGRVQGLCCFGGAIDMAAGDVKRAPRWMQLSGIEALFRVWQQPSRCLRMLRVLRALPMLARGGT